MKVFAIADIHEKEDLLEYVAARDAEGTYDVLLLLGDTLYSRERYSWLERLARPTIMIPGNWDGGPRFDEPISSENVRKLRFGLVNIDGVNFLCAGDYSLNLADRAAEIIRDTDSRSLVLATHYNPFGIRDSGIDESAGHPEILRLLQELKPAYHVFGHDHEGCGSVPYGPTKCINVAAALGGRGAFFEI